MSKLDYNITFIQCPHCKERVKKLIDIKIEGRFKLFTRQCDCKHKYKVTTIEVPDSLSNAFRRMSRKRRWNESRLS